MGSQLLRAATGLLAALTAAAFLTFALFEMHAGSAAGEITFAAALFSALLKVLAYGLPLAALFAAATEFVRFRHVAVHLAGGTAIAFVGAYLATRGEAMSSQAFAGGALTSMLLIGLGVLSGLTYWLVAGRRAGWRGEAAERADLMATEAFRTASANAEVEYCMPCLAMAFAGGMLLFSLLGWFSIEATGMREHLVDDAAVLGKSVLRKAGHGWATFSIDGNRGVVAGTAPDEVQKRAAFDAVREALSSVTGFPGVISAIDNRAIAHVAMSEVTEQLADAQRRATEARVAAEAARVATESARAAEAETRRQAEQQALAVKAEAERKLEEQARIAEAEIKRKLEEQAKTAEAEIKRKLEEQAKAAELEIQRKLEEKARAAAEEEARRQAAEAAEKAEAPPVQPVEVAAAEATPEPARPAVGEEAANAPDVGVETSAASGECTEQDLAIVESSKIYFDIQRFEVLDGYQPELDRLAQSARACSTRPIQVTGYADPNRDSVFNRSLPLQRAEAVRQGLIQRGVPATLVMAQTPGPDAEYEQGPGDHALNRRAEFRFLEASEISRDAKMDPEVRATTCESELAEIMKSSIIHFPTASSRVSADSLPLIKKVANAIQACGSVIVTVEGHTDKIGGETYNQGLSEARSSSVKEALVAAGADPTRLAARGFAASRPADPSETAEAFAMNRRIEFKVSGKFTSTSTTGP